MHVIFDRGNPILDREALLVVLRESNIKHAERTVRNHCKVIGYSDDGRALYDMEACAVALAKVDARPRGVVERNRQLCHPSGDLARPNGANAPASAPTDREHGPTSRESNVQNPTVSNRCTVQKPNGSFCDVRSASGTPFPICAHHARKLFEHMRPDVPPPETARELWDIWNKHIVDRKPLDDEITEEVSRLMAEQSQVYYLRLPGDLIKIGVTVNIKDRLSALRVPEWDLLATEPGLRDAEAQRHKQFAHLRQGRLENFKAAPELLELIGNLRYQFGPPKITTFASTSRIAAQERLNAACVAVGGY